MNLKMNVGLFTLFCLLGMHQYGLAQQSNSVPLPGNGETCNIVNLHCGTAAPNEAGQQPLKGYPGPPGKVGPRGPEGPRGLKGEMGSKGSKGEGEAIVNVTDIINRVVKIFGANNCSQLRDLGISESGYYQIGSHMHIHPIYVYCDFEVYDGVSDCDALRQRKRTIKRGHYLMRLESSSIIEEVACGPSTCDELFRQGITTSGKYTLGGDRAGLFEVHCSFTNGRAITEIGHDQLGEIQNPTDGRCTSVGCYSWTPNYEIGRNYILSVIAKSSECRQFIRAKCVQTVLLSGPYGWWVSRDGEKMMYWGGATSRRDGYCACGETGTCTSTNLKCNCDSNNANTVVDEGYLTDKTKLPVRELRFGDLDDSDEFIWHTLGKLECWGEA